MIRREIKVKRKVKKRKYKKKELSVILSVGKEKIIDFKINKENI